MHQISDARARLGFAALIIAALLGAVLIMPRAASAAAAPTVTPVTIASSNASTTLAKTGDIVTVSFTSSAAALIVPTGTIAGHTATLVATGATSSATVWTAYAATQSGDTEGNVAFSIAVGNADGTGTTTIVAITAGSNVRFDKTAPTVSATTIASNNASTTLAKSGNVVTLSFTTNEGISTPSVTIGAHAAIVSPVGSAGTSWTAAATISLSDTDNSALTFTITTPTDYAGNATTSATWLSSGANVVVDRTAPVITVSGTNPLSIYSSLNAYSDAGASAIDAHDASASVVSSGSVAYSTPGTYTITYTSTDAAGNVGTNSRTVTVLNNGGGGIFGGGSGGTGVIHAIIPGGSSDASSTTSTTSTGTTGGGSAGSGTSLAALLAQLATLQTQLAQLQGGASASGSATFTRDLDVGSTGSDVMALQVWLNAHGYVVAASGAGSSGNETTTFGGKTRAALAKWQKAVGITPAAGYFGAKTRAYLAAHQ